MAINALLFLCTLAPWPLHAQDTGAISQGFQTTETDLTNGALVSLKADNNNTVELANSDRAAQLVGVVGDNSLIELSGPNQSILVVLSGTSNALVSNINGDIKAGDRITASPINGTGMKATSSTQVVGIAQTDFSTVEATNRSVIDKEGTPQTVKMGHIPIQVNVSYYAAPAENDSFLPPFLRALANSVAGKEVSPVRVLISTLVLIFGFVSIAVLLYSSIRSSIISIGRNPLSEAAVRKSLFEVGATSFGILLVMLIAIYLVLTT